LSLLFGCGAALLVGCADQGIQPGDDDYNTVQNALLGAKPGSTVKLAAGTFHFAQQLSLNVASVTLAGAGSDQTILSFTDQSAGSSAIKVTADNFTAQDFAILDPPGDGLDIKGVAEKMVNNVHVQRVSVKWTAAPNTADGPYGIYPVLCNGVLVEDSNVSGASDTGIYVGQSQNIVLRNNTVQNNVAGIEIENSHFADVHDNTASGNTAGILVFGLPGLATEGGGSVRVFNNKIVDNNTDNFAPDGNIVHEVPAGTGTFVMANKGVEIFGNTIQDNHTVSMAVISYLMTGKSYTDDPKYDPYTYAVSMHDNTIIGGGDNPVYDNDLAIALRTYVMLPVPDEIYDGFFNPTSLVQGKVPDELRICFHNNQHMGKPATFANVDGEALLKIEAGMNVTPNVVRDRGANDCTLPALPAVSLPASLQ
jgi:parallel beta-helix repeat protein